MAGLAEILLENTRLRDLLAQRDAQLAVQAHRLQEQEQELARQRAMLEALKVSAEELARELELRKLRESGPASQRFVPPEQQRMPFPADIVAPPRAPEHELACDTGNTEDETGQTATTKRQSGKPTNNKKKPRRRKRDDFAGLDSRKVYCPAPEGQLCSCCGRPLHIVGSTCSVRVNWVPGHFVRDDVEREQCACSNPDCDDFRAVLTVPAPYALDRALCGDALLARCIVDKFADHIPLHRQAKRMRREGVDFSTSTLCGWIRASGMLLGRIALAVRDMLLEASALLADDTGHPVQDGADGTLRKGRMWVVTDQEQAFYAFTPTKEGHFPAGLLDGFHGELLLVDGGSEFNLTVRRLGLKRGGCWSHLRTYFWNARHHHPVEAAHALATIRDLFLIERNLRGLEPDAIRAQRLAQARPLVDGFFTWIAALSTEMRPKSTLGQAVTYARNQEPCLRLFLEYGELPMHNNLSELLLRQNVVGRKNWLFSGSEGGAIVAGYLYTLIGSCMLQGIDPHEYLVDVLGRIQDHPASRVRELTPKEWRLAREAHMAESA